MLSKYKYCIRTKLWLKVFVLPRYKLDSSFVENFFQNYHVPNYKHNANDYDKLNL